MTSTVPTSSPAESWIDIVRSKVNAMRFGTVQIVVHEGQVTQVESTEKTRLTATVAPKPKATRQS